MVILLNRQLDDVLEQLPLLTLISFYETAAQRAGKIYVAHTESEEHDKLEADAKRAMHRIEREVQRRGFPITVLTP